MAKCGLAKCGQHFEMAKCGLPNAVTRTNWPNSDFLGQMRPTVRPRRVEHTRVDGAPKSGAPKGGGPKISRFFPSPGKLVLFFPLWGSSRGILVVFSAGFGDFPGVFSWNFGGVFERRGAQRCTFGVLGLLCEAPAAPLHYTLHTTQHSLHFYTLHITHCTLHTAQQHTNTHKHTQTHTNTSRKFGQSRFWPKSVLAKVGHTT